MKLAKLKECRICGTPMNKKEDWKQSDDCSRLVITKTFNCPSCKYEFTEKYEPQIMK